MCLSAHAVHVCSSTAGWAAVGDVSRGPTGRRAAEHGSGRLLGLPLKCRCLFYGLLKIELFWPMLTIAEPYYEGDVKTEVK